VAKGRRGTATERGVIGGARLAPARSEWGAAGVGSAATSPRTACRMNSSHAPLALDVKEKRRPARGAAAVGPTVRLVRGAAAVGPTARLRGAPPPA
jgi:hypothetical protein